MVARKSIAVIPFDNMNEDVASEYLVDGLAEDIMVQLSIISDLKVISPTSCLYFKNSDKTLQEIGEELGVVTVLEGSARREGDHVHATARLVDVQTGKQIWTGHYDREMKDIFAIQSDAVQQIASALKANISPGEKERIKRKPTEDLAAYDYYSKGRYYWNRQTEDGMKIGHDYFKLAANKDTTFARAYTRLADSYVLFGMYDWLTPEEAFPQAKAAAMKALEVDATLAQAHAILGAIKMNYDWDWEGAERELRSAVELNPNNANAHQWYSFYLLAKDRSDEASKEIQRAQELDPLSPTINTSAARNLYFMRQYSEAIDRARKVAAKTPNYLPVYDLQFLICIRKGAPREAITAVQKGMSMSGGSPKYVGMLGVCYATMGMKDEALEILNQIQKLSEEKFVPSFGFALVYLYLGERDKFFEFMDKACEERYWSVGALFTPLFDEIRSDPRFTALTEKVGLK